MHSRFGRCVLGMSGPAEVVPPPDGKDHRSSTSPAFSSTVVSALVGLLDIDAFFASAEVVKDPALAGLPIVVAHDHPRSVVSTASYQARRFGIHAGQPLARARSLCPGLLVREPDFEWYKELSLECFAALASRVPVFEPLSMDEAVFPVDSSVSDVSRWLHSLQADVFRRTRLTVSLGAGPSRVVAKLAASAAKPGGVVCVDGASVPVFVSSHSLSDIPGVGPASLLRLTDLGVETVADALGCIEVLPQDVRKLVEGLFDVSTPGIVSLPPPPKSVSVVSTFEQDTRTAHELRSAFESSAALLADRLFSVADAASTVSVRLRSPDFSTTSRSVSSKTPASSAASLHDMLDSALVDLTSRLGYSFRMIALTASNLAYHYPMSLLEPTPPRPHRWVAGERCSHGLFGPGWVLYPSEESLIVRFTDGRVRVMGKSSLTPTHS